MDGTLYRMRDDVSRADKERADRLCAKLNALPIEERRAREELIRELFGSVGERPAVMPRFHCDNGKNIFAGDDLLINYNVTILDRAEVRIGSHVLIAPNVTIATANHPLDYRARQDGYGIASPITIGDDVWIGANAVIPPGVTIGNRVVIAAGAVVTKDLPDDVLAAGVPAAVIQRFDIFPEL